MATGTYSYPQGQPNDLEAIKLALPEVMDEIIAEASITGAMAADPRIVNAIGKKAGTISLGTIDMDGLGNYNRNKGYPEGSVNLTWEDYRLEYDRARTFLLDEVDVAEAGGAATATYAMSEFVRMKVTPEVDRIRIARAAQAGIAGENVEYGYTPGNADFLSKIEDVVDAVRDGSGMEAGTVVYLNKKYRAKLRKTSEVQITRNVTGGTSIDTRINDINDARVQWVPDAYMRSAFGLNDGVTSGQTVGGLVDDPSAAEIVMIAVAPNTVQGVVSHTVSKIIPAEGNKDADGSQINYRIYHDAFVQKNKMGGVYVVASTAEGA